VPAAQDGWPGVMEVARKLTEAPQADRARHQLQFAPARFTVASFTAASISPTGAVCRMPWWGGARPAPAVSRDGTPRHWRISSWC